MRPTPLEFDPVLGEQRGTLPVPPTSNRTAEYGDRVPGPHQRRPHLVYIDVCSESPGWKPTSSQGGRR
jgi:hypothetical protein